MEGLDISSVDDTWVKIRDIKSSAEEKVGILETHGNKPWFDQEYSELANKRKQAKLLWLQTPNDLKEIGINTRNLPNAKYEVDV